MPGTLTPVRFYCRGVQGPFERPHQAHRRRDRQGPDTAEREVLASTPRATAPHRGRPTRSGTARPAPPASGSGQARHDTPTAPAPMMTTAQFTGVHDSKMTTRPPTVNAKNTSAGATIQQRPPVPTVGVPRAGRCPSACTHAGGRSAPRHLPSRGRPRLLRGYARGQRGSTNRASSSPMYRFAASSGCEESGSIPPTVLAAPGLMRFWRSRTHTAPSVSSLAMAYVAAT
jgi:hypothetical protein